MSRMFESTEIRGMRLANRFVRSATWEGLADEAGGVTPGLRRVIRDLVRGEVGLIISGHAYVREDGKAGPGQMGIDRDPLIPGLREMTREVHDHGGRIVCQITHGGFFASPKLTGKPVLAPSNVLGFARTPREAMTVRQIGEIIDCFGEAARRAREAGFDGVQIHGAHGYLLSQFVSPVFNRRSDGYGGPVENRARALLETLARVRGAVGEDFPVLVKLNGRDFISEGLPLEDSLRVGVLLEEGGIDAVEVSGGTVASGKFGPSRPGIRSEEKEAYFREESRAFKAALGVPVILVGGNRSLSLSERLVDEGYADYIAMSRPLIREPGLVRRWKGGDLERARCVSDNLCFGPGRAGKGVYCVTEEKETGKGSHPGP